MDSKRDCWLHSFKAKTFNTQTSIYLISPPILPSNSRETFLPVEHGILSSQNLKNTLRLFFLGKTNSLAGYK